MALTTAPGQVAHRVGRLSPCAVASHRFLHIFGRHDSRLAGRDLRSLGITPAPDGRSRDNPLMLVADNVIPDSELSWTFSPSGGPGGQHANRSNTRAEVRFDLARSPSLPESLKEHMLRRLGKRAVDGVVSVTADETRSQSQNRRIAVERLASLLNEAAHRPRRRRPTRPTASSRERRLEQKKRRSALKRDRGGGW